MLALAWVGHKEITLEALSLLILEPTYGDSRWGYIVHNCVKQESLVAYERCILYFCESRLMGYR